MDRGCLTETALTAMEEAAKEARRSGDRTIKPEHLLMGIINEGKGAAIELLMRSDAAPAILGKELKSPRAVPTEKSSIPDDPELDIVLEHAKLEANYDSTPCVGTDHMLLALLKHSRASKNGPDRMARAFSRLKLTYPKMKEVADSIGARNDEANKAGMKRRA